MGGIRRSGKERRNARPRGRHPHKRTLDGDLDRHCDVR